MCIGLLYSGLDATTKTGRRHKGLAKGDTHQWVAFWLMWLHTIRNCLNHVSAYKMLKVVSRRTKSSSRDAIMDESHMKGSKIL